MYNLKKFGLDLRKIRKRLGLSQTEVASRISMQRDTFTRLENGMSIPKIETLSKLSNIYGRDIFLLFCEHRITVDNYISDNLQIVSKHFGNHNYSLINDEIKKFEDTFSDIDYYDKDYLIKKVNQYKAFLESIANINSTIDDRSREHITKLFLSLELSQSEIKKQNVKLDKLELRIIIMLGTVYRYKNELISTIDLLNLSLKVINREYNNDKEYLYFYILVQFNRMSYYHRLDQFSAVKIAYEETLQVIDDKLGIRLLFGFFTRAGMNKHFMKEPHFEGLVQAGLQLLKDNDELVLYESNLKNLKEKYPYLNFDLLYFD